MKNVIGYIRVSTDGQAKDDKFGLDVQRTQIEEYCKKNDMHFMDKIKSIDGVEDATLIQYNGEYHG